MESLPEGILEDVLLRLPYVTVVYAKDVCKKWKEVIESKSYARSYRSTVKLTSTEAERKFVYEVVDSSNSVLRSGTELDSLGSITSHINGLLLSVTTGDKNENCYIGNIFTNGWEEFATPPEGYLHIRDTAIFYLGNGQYKLVYWRCDDIVMTLETGQKEWSVGACLEAQEESTSTDPIVISNSVFRVQYYPEGFLMEYESVQCKLKRTRITSTKEEPLDFDREFVEIPELIEWQGKLFLVMVDEVDEGERQTLEMWEISKDDGHASFVSKFEMEQKIDKFAVKGVEDEFLHLQCDLSDQTSQIMELVYNMAARSIQVTNVTNTRTNFVSMPVKLYQG